MTSTPSPPTSPAKASIRHINFSTTKRAPLTPLRAFKPTPVRPVVAFKPEFSPSPLKQPRPEHQEPLFLSAPSTPVAEVKELNGQASDSGGIVSDVASPMLFHDEEKGESSPPSGSATGLDPRIRTPEVPDSPFFNPQEDEVSVGMSAVQISPKHPRTPVLSDMESEPEVLVRRAPARTPKRIALSDSEADSPIAGPSKPRLETRAARRIAISDSESDDAGPRRRVIDMTCSDDECEEDEDKEQAQAWMDKYYDDSAGSLRDFIVDDSDESEEENGSDDSDESVRPTSRKSKPKPPAGKSTRTADLELPDFNRLTIVDSSDDDDETGSISRPVIPVTPGRKSKKSWEQERVKIAEDVFADLDKRVFEGKLGPKGAGATIEWSNRMLTTAGTANQQKKREADGSTRQVIKITLSMKVCTGEEQILSTVAHEMCHLATWIISKEMKNPHGRIFKSWGARVMKARRDIEVTTKHTYEIEYKFQWKCVKDECGKIYQRHSKSIDVEKDRCRCRGALEPMFETKETAYQAYLKQNMGYAKQALPGASHGDVMRALALRWKTAGQDGNHLEYWLAEIAA